MICCIWPNYESLRIYALVMDLNAMEDCVKSLVVQNVQTILP